VRRKSFATLFVSCFFIFFLKLLQRRRRRRRQWFYRPQKFCVCVFEKLFNVPQTQLGPKTPESGRLKIRGRGLGKGVSRGENLKNQ